MPDPMSETSSADLPVRMLPGERADQPAQGTALCLSGGGYRAMLFHVGAILRLNDAAMLPTLKRVSSVSGGSITAAVLGMNWGQLAFDTRGVAQRLDVTFVHPVRELASRTLDENSILAGLLLPGTIADKVTAAYDKYVFKGKTLGDLPDDSTGPRFVINATNVQTGSLWRFSKPYMGDWRIGLISNHKQKGFALARAVAASSAFPPVLSPLTFTDVNPGDFDASTTVPPNKGGLFTTPYNDTVVLSDGGVYDNLGLETAWKNYRTVLVSDGGMRMGGDPEPKGDWAQHALRVLNVIDNQVRSLRKRQLIDRYVKGMRAGAYWGIGSRFEDYRAGQPTLADPLNLAGFDPTPLATVKTRLKRLDAATQERLINWGYAICDTALRRHVTGGAAGAPVSRGDLPFPVSGL
jgi:NTE family protein